MKLRTSISAILFIIIAVPGSKFAYSAATDSDSFQIGGDIEKTTTWTNAILKDQFASEIKPIHYASRGKQHMSNCVSLIAVLTAAGAPTQKPPKESTDPKTKNISVRIAVVVQGRDGYVAVFSLAELLPEFGNKDAWLALDFDGSPLAANEGPVRLIIPLDVKPARWVRGVQSITILDARKLIH